MKNRTLILNDLIKMQVNNVSFEEMSNKLQHYALSYYESLNILYEVTHKSLEDISSSLLSQQYWQEKKMKSDETEESLKAEYESILTVETKQQKFDQYIEESYNSLLETKNKKANKLNTLDNTLGELFN